MRESSIMIGGIWTPPVGQTSRDHLASASIARQRKRERVIADMLFGRLLKTSLLRNWKRSRSRSSFFGEDASATGAAARDSVRSRKADARRRMRRDERPERKGAGVSTG